MTIQPAAVPLKFRKKPVVITARQFDGTAEMATRLALWIGDSARAMMAIGEPYGNGAEHYIEIRTLEGTLRAEPGDWIICGVKGEFYPCKPAVFEITYEPVA